MLRSLTIFIFTTISYISQAQNAGYLFRNISINEGLSQSSVVDIHIDHSGFAWLATQDGLNRYDGKEFISFQKNFDDITTSAMSQLGKILPGVNNDLWLITAGGNLENFNILQQTSRPVSTLDKAKLKLTAVNSVLDEPAVLWIGTREKGLLKYVRDKGIIEVFNTRDSKPVISGNHVQEIFRDSNGQHWILTNNGITLFNRDNSGNRLLLQPKNSSTSPISCSAIAEDKNNGIWLGTFGKGLFRKHKDSSDLRQFVGFPSAPLPTDIVIETVLADSDGLIWLGTYGNGLYIINEKESSVKHIIADKRNPFSLGYNDVLSIKQDSRGGIWLGTDGGGISYYNRRLNNFYTYSKNNLPENVSVEQVRSITTDNDANIWVGTSNSGLTFISKDRAQAQAIPLQPSGGSSEVGYQRIVSLLKDVDGDIWVGTQDRGILILSAKSRKLIKQFSPEKKGANFFPDRTIWCLLPDKEGRVWAGTRNTGLCLINKKTGLIKYSANHSQTSFALPDTNVRTLTRINDSIICLGLENNGIRFLNTKTDGFINFPIASTERILPPETIVRSTCYLHPILWIGTFGKGLMAFNLSTGKLLIFTEKNGLPNNTIYGIEPDKVGSLWLSSNKGLCRFLVPADLASTNHSLFIRYTVEDGLQSNEFNTGAHYNSADGLLFFGGINGLSFFNPTSLSQADLPPAPLITQILDHNQPLPTDTLISYKKILHLDYNQNSLAFNFATPGLVAAGRLNYYYQLVGDDKNWIDAGNRNYAAYTNLAPGTYTFRIKVSQNVPDSRDPITQLKIVIKPPYWQTWWFILACIGVVLAILFGIYRYRISQLIRLQKVRNRIASDLHDDIGSSLTNINILSELSRKNLGKEPEATLFLNRITEEVTTSGQALDDIVWSINTNNDTLEQTVARMRRYAAEVFEGAGISYSLVFDEKFSHRKLSMELRRDFFLIFKELINNIYKHANAKNVNIETGLKHSRVFLNIKDDGKGYDQQKMTHRNGLNNMRQRAKKWEGSMVVKTGLGMGTFSQFEFALD